MTRRLIRTAALLAALATTSVSASAQQLAPSRFARNAAPVATVAPSASDIALTPTLTVDTPAPAPAPAPKSGFASSGFAQFMASTTGRVVRAVAGAAMIGGGLSMNSGGGNALAIVGAVPLAAGVFDFCVLSPLFGGPFSGKDIRAAK